MCQCGVGWRVWDGDVQVEGFEEGSMKENS